MVLVQLDAPCVPVPLNANRTGFPTANALLDFRFEGRERQRSREACRRRENDLRGVLRFAFHDTTIVGRDRRPTSTVEEAQRSTRVLRPEHHIHDRLLAEDQCAFDVVEEVSGETMVGDDETVLNSNSTALREAMTEDLESMLGQALANALAQIRCLTKVQDARRLEAIVCLSHGNEHVDAGHLRQQLELVIPNNVTPNDRRGRRLLAAPPVSRHCCIDQRERRLRGKPRMVRRDHI